MDLDNNIFTCKRKVHPTRTEYSQLIVELMKESMLHKESFIPKGRRTILLLLRCM